MLELDDPVSEALRPALRRCRRRQPPAARQPFGAAPAQRGAAEAARSKRWSARCCGRCSRTGSTAPARDRRGTRHPRDRPHHRARPAQFRVTHAAVLGRRPMNKLMLAGLAALAFAQAPAAFARPITATDLATMRRLASPSGLAGRQLGGLPAAARPISPPIAAATICGCSTCVTPARSRRGSPRRAEHNEHDPHFSADGRWRSIISATLRAATSSGGSRCRAGRRSGSPISPPTSAAICWRRPATGSRSGPTATWPAPTSTAPACRRRRRGRGSGRVYDQTFVRHWDTWAEPGLRSRIFTFAAGRRPAAGRGHAGRAEPGRRCAVQAVRRRRGARLEPGRPHPLFHLARGGPARAQFDQSRHFRGPRRRRRAAGQPHRRQPGHGHLPAVSPDGRWLAYAAMARPTYEADRQVVQLRNLATGETRALTEGWDRSVGSIAWAPDGRSLLVTAGDTLDNPSSASTSRTGRATRLTQAGTAGNVLPLARRLHAVHAEQPPGARRSLAAATARRKPRR